MAMLIGRVALLQPPRLLDPKLLDDSAGRATSRVWMLEGGDHVYFSPLLRRWIQIDCDAVIGYQYGIERSVRRFFLGNLHLLAPEVAVESGNFDVAYVEHCFSHVHHFLRFEKGFSHTLAMQDSGTAALFGRAE
eukprot:TRINITY_DN35723_c0_g1_i1.p1 TRINITY_DN35723_c0_g1~~TRINITY_DN35723_c0_g1_i1.p1  ORF type:complete len:143 (-),score=25.41 TRINITY_DN35723_c0_g1_i1:70-471(-)